MPSNTPLLCTLTASDGSNILYIGSSATANVLTLTLKNTSTSVVTLQACSTSNTWINALPQTESGVYLLFNGLLSNSVVAGIALSNASGWRLQTYSDDQCGQYLVLLPESNQELGVNESVSFTLTVPAITGSAADGYFSCQYVNVLTDVPVSGGSQLYMSLQFPPRSEGGAAEQLPVQFEFVGTNIVYNDSHINTLKFRLTNSGATALVPGGTAIWGATHPQFRLSFVQDESLTPGSLLNSHDAGGVTVTVSELYSNHLIVDKQSSTSPQIWTIAEDTAVLGSNGTVLGTGLSASVEFLIDQLVTNVPPSITMAILEYVGIPGYPDGQLVAEIEIQNPPAPPPPLPEISSFSVTPNLISISSLPASVSISLAIANAVSYEVYAQGVLLTSGSVGSSFNYYFSTSLYGVSLVELKVKNSTGQEVSRSLVVQVDTVPLGTIMMWSGNQASIPSGWHLCDGGRYNNRTTPNLISRFVTGAANDTAMTDSTYHLNQVGGNSSHDHTVNIAGQSLTITGGNHSHQINFNATTAVKSDSTHAGGNNYYHGNNNNSIETTDGSGTSSNGSHSHTATVYGQTPTTSPVSSLPPFYALYYIMKCS